MRSRIGVRGMVALAALAAMKESTLEIGEAVHRAAESAEDFSETLERNHRHYEDAPVPSLGADYIAEPRNRKERRAGLKPRRP